MARGTPTENSAVRKAGPKVEQAAGPRNDPVGCLSTLVKGDLCLQGQPRVTASTQTVLEGLGEFVELGRATISRSIWEMSQPTGATLGVKSSLLLPCSGTSVRSM